VFKKCIHNGNVYTICLLAFFLHGGANIARADHDPNIIHACSKNKTFRIVNTTGDCRAGESHLALATEAALNALLGSTTDLQSQIDALNTLTRRLHGNQAAVINDIIAGSGTIPGPPGGWEVTIIFCDKDDLGGNIDCDENSGIALRTPLLTDNDERSVISFNAGNTPDFPSIAELVSNGENDVIKVETLYYKGGGILSGGGASTSPDWSLFNRNTQTTTGPEFMDLVGLDIDSVDVAIDRIVLFYDSNNDKTTADIDYRIFFGLAP
jgi:hypothetical protein